jgi:hypothetical protein
VSYHFEAHFGSAGKPKLEIIFDRAMNTGHHPWDLENVRDNALRAAQRTFAVPEGATHVEVWQIFHGDHERFQEPDRILAFAPMDAEKVTHINSPLPEGDL